MRSTAPRARRWSVGALAKAAGVTVRTLHHYEQAGLLAPPARSEGGHRLYEAADVERLYRIRALCELGLSLEEARQALAGGADLSQLLTAQLAGVEAEIARLSGLRDRLLSLTQGAAPVTAQDLLETLDAMSRVERHMRRRRGENTTIPEPRWRLIGDALREAMMAGEPPSSGRAQAAARQMQALIEEFTGGDPVLRQALAQLRRLNPPRTFAGWDRELMDYMALAMAALEQD